MESVAAFVEFNQEFNIEFHASFNTEFNLAFPVEFNLLLSIQFINNVMFCWCKHVVKFVRANQELAVSLSRF